jgi:hypothetical protein
MSRTIRMVALLICVPLLTLMAHGCQSVGHAPKQQWSQEPIHSFGSVAGKWAGLLVRAPKVRKDDWIRLSIDHDGRYEFATYRTIGVFSGRGYFTLADGKLTVTTERGTATGSLLVSDGLQMMRFIGIMEDGTQYTAELEPSR